MKGFAVYQREYTGEITGTRTNPCREDNIIAYLMRICFMTKGKSKKEKRQNIGEFDYPTEKSYFKIRVIPLSHYKETPPKYIRQITIESMPPSDAIPGELEELLTQHGFSLKRKGIVNPAPKPANLN